jgi:hypothetical protein
VVELNDDTFNRAICRTVSHILSGAKAKDKDGLLPIQSACSQNAPAEVVCALLAVYPDGEAA